LVHASHLPGARVTENIEGPLQTARARDALLAVASVASVASVGDQPLAEVLADSRYEPLLLGLARELQAGRGGPLTQRVVELFTAIEQGRRPCAQENLDLLAAHERLERLGRPLNAACAAIGAPDRAHGVHGVHGAHGVRPDQRAQQRVRPSHGVIDLTGKRFELLTGLKVTQISTWPR
jgi:hypothetical protein